MRFTGGADNACDLTYVGVFRFSREDLSGKRNDQHKDRGKGVLGSSKMKRDLRGGEHGLEVFG